MKKQFSMVLALLLAVTLTACGTVSKETAGSTADTAQNTAVNSTAQSADTSNTAADGVSNAANASNTSGTASSGSVTITLAAAASLKNVFDEKLIPAFEAANPGITVTGTYDSSGKLQTQIEEGLGADLFFSAAAKQMDALAAEGKVDKAGVVNLLENKLVLITSTASSKIFTSFQDVVSSKTIAVGDPESVPAGQYAKESLTNLGIWDKISDRLSLGSNVTEVLTWVAEGSADCGFVYATDAASMPNAVTVCAEAPADSLKTPIVYPVAVLSDAPQKDAARKFLAYLTSDDAMKIFESYGFTDNRGK